MEHKTHDPYLVFMLLLCCLALAILAVETLFALDQETLDILDVADTVICVLFFVDFVISFRQARNKWRYMLTWGWLDLVSSIPALDVLRLGRAARVLRIIRVLRAVRAARVWTVFIVDRRAQSTMLAAALLSIILVVVSAIAVLHFEAPLDGNIQTGEDAIWWAMATVTTVGYGDRYPVSPEGRMLAAVLMVAGVGMFATLSGVLASWFLAPTQAERHDEIAALRQELAEIKQLVAALQRKDDSTK